jgi:predicted transcriptional regulator
MGDLQMGQHGESASRTEVSEYCDMEHLRRLSGLLSLLSKMDALLIFILANAGVKSDTNTSDSIGLSRKQYYTRLKQLVDAGLIQKHNRFYLHTTMGKFIYARLFDTMLASLKNRTEMKMLDVLREDPEFSSDEFYIKDLLGSTGYKNT